MKIKHQAPEIISELLEHDRFFLHKFLVLNVYQNVHKIYCVHTRVAKKTLIIKDD